MIRRITGTAVEVGPTHAVIDVAGMGYLIYTTAHAAIVQGEVITLFTHLAVRENALDLYGFTKPEDLSFFEQLLTLPKIGPKSALQILSQADTSLLLETIIAQDHEHLSKMSGISKKTAEKIVLGLKDAFEGYELHSSSQSILGGTKEVPSFSSDAIDALITLGYPQSDARKAVQQLLTEKPGIANTNDAIREALKLL